MNMTPEEKAEFDDLKGRVAFLEQLCLEYHDAIIDFEKGYTSPNSSFQRDLLLLHNPNIGPLMRLGNRKIWRG